MSDIGVLPARDSGPIRRKAAVTGATRTADTRVSPTAEVVRGHEEGPS